MNNEFEEIQETFITESTELLERMENALYQLETDLENSDSINAVFRAIHTIKGTSGMFGFDYIVHFTHDVENLLDKIRDGKVALNPELIKIFLEARDHTQELIEVESSGQVPSATLQNKSQEILEKLKPYSGAKPTASPQKEIVQAPQQNNDQTGNNKFWHITLRPGKNTFQNALEPMSFIQYLNKFGKIINLVTVTAEVPETSSEFDPESSYLSFEIQLESSADEATIKQNFDFLEYDSFIRVIPPFSPFEKYDELIATTKANKSVYEKILSFNGAYEAVKTPTVVQEIAAPKPEKTPNVEAADNEAKKDTANTNRESKTLRVDSSRIDQLINLVGELVISGANITQLVTQETNNEKLNESSQILLRLVGEIRENTLKLRMVPIGETFQKFSRIVREVGRELNKDVKLQIHGGETELDKTVVEKINDPLVHIIRNAIDHGLETGDVRKANGKPESGTLTLSAFHDTGSIVIKIEDDGKGLSRDKILAKAIQKGILKEDEKYSDNEIFNTIFQPGLSTAEKITNISGRGVGLDVVQRNIESLRGNVTINSTEGQGTSFTIRLPLTLAIIEGFLVGVAESLYILPLDTILECVDFDRSVENQNIDQNEKSNFINLRGEVLPIVRIAEIFNEKNRKNNRESIVIVQNMNKKIGLVVDKLYGEIQTVIKPLGKLFDKTKFLSGATILGNGNVAMILDVGSLLSQLADMELKDKMSLTE